MVEILKNPVTIYLPFKNYPHTNFHYKLDYGLDKWMTKKKGVFVHGFNKMCMVEEDLTISGAKWVLFGYNRKDLTRVFASYFENGLVNEEEEEDSMSIPVNEEIPIVSDEEKVILPPWGNVDIEEDESLELRGDSIPSPSYSGKLSCNLEPRLHFLEERDEEILSERVLNLSRCNKVRSAFDLFMSMEFSNLRPNLYACNSLLSCLLRNGFLSDALKVFEIMKKKEMTTGHSFSLILKAVATIQGCDSALEMFMTLESESRNFDAIVYNTMISICGKANNWIQTEKLWRSLKENGHQATEVTYGLLISIFVRSGQSELALDAYNEMIENRLNPSEDMMKAIISASIKEGNWNFALEIFRSMLKYGFNPNSITYNSMINSLGKAGEIELAFKVFDLMRSSEHKPDVYTWNALLSALYRGNRFMDVLRLFESIKREKNSELNSHLYNTALMSCQRLGLWDRSLQLLWQMEEDSMMISVESYNLVIDACEVARKPKIALQVYEHMVHKNCVPNTFTYLSLIRSCIWGSLWSEVDEILDVVGPNVSVYNAAIHGMCLRGEISSAKNLYMKMQERGLQPDGKTRALMLQNLNRASVRQSHSRWHPSRRRS